jgi:hypothetical protein
VRRARREQPLRLEARIVERGYAHGHRSGQDAEMAGVGDARASRPSSAAGPAAGSYVVEWVELAQLRAYAEALVTAFAR